MHVRVQKGTRKKEIQMSVQVKDLLHMNPNIRTQELVVASGFSESAIVRWRLDILGEQSQSRLLSQARALADTVPAAMSGSYSKYDPLKYASPVHATSKRGNPTSVNTSERATSRALCQS